MNCDESLQVSIRASKGVTLLFQVAVVLMMAWQLRKREQWQGVKQSQAVILAYSSVGALHSLSLVCMFPSDVSQEAALFIVEYLYSLYNALLIAALVFLTRVWLEIYVPGACPSCHGSIAHLVRIATVGGWAVTGFMVLVAMASDTALVASHYKSTFSVVVHVQHFVFMSVCVCFGIASMVLPPRILRRACEAERKNGGTPDSLGVGRARVALYLLVSVWVFCALFCLTCAIGGALNDGRNPTSSAETSAWVMHASFVFMGGSGIAWIIFELLNRPDDLDPIARRLSPDVPKAAETKGPQFSHEVVHEEEC